jgi:uncharacterized lipoprotein YddW (UPF0748 family)
VPLPVKLIPLCQAATALALLLAASPSLAGVTNRLLGDFENGLATSATAVTASNSAATAASGSVITNVTETGSRRLQLVDSNGGVNGFLVTIPGAITAAGNYLLTAEIKVSDTPSAPIASFGMGAAIGTPTTAEVQDTHGGYIMNLTPGSSAALGYQKVGAAIQSTAGPYPQTVTLYFSTNPTGNSFVNPYDSSTAPATDGNHINEHRTTSATWASGSTNAVYVDNIRIIGPGSFGEDRHYWISAGNSYNNLARVKAYINIAHDNGFNCVDILARFRSDAYYVPHRDFSTYPNPEPFGTLVGTSPAISAANDPLQFAIDQCHELGMKAYISFSCFLATPNNTYPSYLPSGSQQYVYNNGTPRVQTSTDTTEGVWADVGRSDVRTHLVNVMRDIVQNYDLDGVIFDRIRYSDSAQSLTIGSGYNPVALAEMGYAPGVYPLPTDPTFVTKRRANVAKYLHDAYEAATDIKPWMVVGTVPVVYGHDFTSTYDSVFQFWPYWTAAATRNRAFSFGAQDVMQPQFYRQAGSAYELDNARYCDYLRYGDIGAYSKDFGFMNGANALMAPLFYHPTTGSTTQSNLNAQNLRDALNKECSGGGIYSADTVRTDIRLIRKAVTTSGPDALAGFPAHPDYLMKAGYDNTPPNAVTNLAFANSPGSLNVQLTWTAPAPAADGQSAARYLVYRGTTADVRQYYATLRNKATTVTAALYNDTVPAGGSYWYAVVAVDNYNNRSTPVLVGPVAVTSASNPAAPSAPSSLVAFLMGNVVHLKWNDNSTVETSFELQRDSVTIATTSENVFTFTDHDVPAGSHTYRVRAANPAGTSAFSATATVTAANNVAAPTGIAANDGGGVAVVSWTDAAPNESGTEILRATAAAGPFSQVGTVGPDLTSYTDLAATVGTFYYRVRSYNGTDYSLRSATATVTLSGASAPAAPTGLNATVIGSTVQLTWTDNSNNEARFEVLRSTTSGGPYTLVASTNPNATSYLDAPPSVGTYYYVVRAANLVGTSANSNQASATVTTTVPADIILESRQPGGAITSSPTYTEGIQTTGTWSNTTAKSTAPGLTGTGARWTGNSSVGSYVVFTPSIQRAGNYSVYITGPNSGAGPNVNSPGAGYLVTTSYATASGTFTNSSSNAAMANTWMLLAADVPFPAGATSTIRITNNNATSADSGQRFNIDAIKLTYTSALPSQVNDWSVY